MSRPQTHSTSTKSPEPRSRSAHRREVAWAHRSWFVPSLWELIRPSIDVFCRSPGRGCLGKIIAVPRIGVRQAGRRSDPWSGGELIYTIRNASMGETMGIGTSRYLPLGITTDDRWGAARRRRLVAICALCALAAAGFVVAEKASDLMATRSADAQSAGISPGMAEAPVKPPATTEAPNFAATAILPETVPVAVPSPPSAAAAIEPASMPAPAAPEPPSPPTVLRGAGIKPR
jgi:hypothetical protein